MLVQGAGVELRQHGHLLDMRVGHVAEREIYGAVAACDRHCGDRSFVGEFPHPVVVAACQDNTDCSHDASPSFAVIT